MFSKVALFIAASMAVFVAAAPTAPGSQACSTGPVQCCNQVHKKDSSEFALFHGLLPIGLQDVTGSLALDCSPLSVVGLGGNSCSAQTVCCQDNTFNGLINVGCTPINLNA